MADATAENDSGEPVAGDEVVQDAAEGFQLLRHGAALYFTLSIETANLSAGNVEY